MILCYDVYIVHMCCKPTDLDESCLLTWSSGSYVPQQTHRAQPAAAVAVRPTLEPQTTHPGDGNWDLETLEEILSRNWFANPINNSYDMICHTVSCFRIIFHNRS